MDDDPQAEFNDFGSTEALVKDIQERSDDITKVVLLRKKNALTRNGASFLDLSNTGMILHFVGGKARLVTIQDAQAILNDGILNRMKIRIEID